MRKLLTLIAALFAFGAVSAQSYYYVQGTGTASPYAYNTAGTNILTTGTEVLSTWQTLPFSWNFYGNAVTGYYASDNGYITFDNGAASSFNANTTLPNAAGPNNAIYAFWDDFTVNAASGNPDVVRTWTYGTTPNRVHCIQWWSMTPVADANSWIYATIRIYEGGDFDIVLDYGAASASAATSGTIGCENGAGNDGTTVNASAAYQYPSLTTAATDDIVYTFVYGTQPAFDVEVVSSGFNGTCAIGNNSVTGTLKNNGTTAITSLRLNYSVDGAAAVSTNLSSLNITSSGGSYNFTHPTAWNVPTGGTSYNLRIWADNLNGSNPDDVPANDTLEQDLLSTLGINAPKDVMIEEFTGAWCQFCPDGVVVLNQLETAHPNDVHIVSVHDGDAMEYAEGIRTAFTVSSYPSANIDRWKFPSEAKVPCSRGQWSSYTTQRLNADSPVGVSVTNTYNSATRTASVTVTADFVDYAVGDLRIGLAVIEDSVTGTGTGYNQVNYYNTQSGHPYYGAGNPIVGFIHRHVLRANPAGVMGQSGLIPSTATPGGSYTYSVDVTLPAAWDENQIHFVGFVYRNEADVLEGEVLNSGEVELNLNPTSNDDPFAGQEGLNGIYPNPTSGIAFAEIEFAEATDAVVEIYNLMGQKLDVVRETTFAAGSHRVYFDTQNQESGVYLLSVKSEKGVWTQKFVVTH